MIMGMGMTNHLKNQKNQKNQKHLQISQHYNRIISKGLWMRMNTDNGGFFNAGNSFFECYRIRLHSAGDSMDDGSSMFQLCLPAALGIMILVIELKWKV